MPELLVPFLVVTALLIISPGPDMALVVRNGARRGANGAWWTGLGCCVGNTIHATAAVVGLSAILAASATAYTVIKLAGAAYLVWLGIQALWSSRPFRGRRASHQQGTAEQKPAVTSEPTTSEPVTSEPVTSEPVMSGPPPRGSWFTDFRQGIMSDLLNPKIALLFLTLLPQFVAVDESRVTTSLKLAAVFVLISIVWWRLFSLAVGGIGGVLSRGPVRAWFERVTGAVLVGLGITVIFE
jgi:threonine/homoserine/homoserine lactone efflux protein